MTATVRSSAASGQSGSAGRDDVARRVGGAGSAGVVEAVRRLAAAPVGVDARRSARLRLADTAFATLVGGRTRQGRRSAALAADRYGAGSVAGRAFRMVAACRMTEIDDIDLRACVTPGSVVVPTVLALLGADARIAGTGLDGVLDAVVRGYEVALGLGEAIRGPQRLATGVWPTLTVGGVTAAAVTSWLFGAAPDEVAAAVALAAEHSVQGNPRGDAREVLLADAVVTGIGAAQAVRHGFRVTGGRGGALGVLLADPGADADPGAGAGSGGGARIHRPSIKPFCSARQAMTAVSAVRSILGSGDVAVDDIDRIDLEVPAAYAAMLDKPTVGSRRDSLSSAPYQVALAALDPAGLYDVERPVLRSHDAFRALMAAVHVRPADDLTPLYPARWPARVLIRAAGRTVEAFADEVPGERDVSVRRLVAKARDFTDAVAASPSAGADLVERAVTANDVTDLRAITALIDSETTKEALA